MIGNTLPLNVEVNAKGVANVRQQLGQVEAAVGKVGRATSGMNTVMGRIGGAARGGLGALGRGLSGAGGWMRGQMGGMMGMVGAGLGVAGLVSLVKETADYDQALVSMQLALRLTDEQTQKLDADMADLAKRTGDSRKELLDAARAATDYGLELDKAVEFLPDASLLAKILGVSVDAVAPALGGLDKLSGGKLSARELEGLTYEAQAKSGLPEDMLLKLIAQLGPQLAGVTGGDQRSLSFLMANISAVGEVFAGPKGAMKLKSGLEELVRALADPRYAKIFEKLEIDTNDLSGAEGKLLLALASGDKEVLKLSSSLTDFLNVVLQSEGGMKRFNDTHEATSGDLAESTAAVTAALDKMERTSTVTWGQMIEEFKAPLQDMARGALAYFVEHKDEIREGIQNFVKGIQEVTSWLAEWWPVALAAALAGKAIPAVASLLGGGPMGAAVGVGLAGGAVAAYGVSELMGWEDKRRAAEEAAAQAEHETTLSKDRQGFYGDITEGGYNSAADVVATMITYLASFKDNAELRANARDLASSPEEAAYLSVQGARMRAGQPIEIKIYTSPDGAYTEAHDGATDSTIPTTTTTDGRTASVAVGG